MPCARVLDRGGKDGAVDQVPHKRFNSSLVSPCFNTHACMKISHGLKRVLPMGLVFDAAADTCAHISSQFQETTTIQDLPGLPSGVKFDPTDQEHLEGKARPAESRNKLHPLVDEFTPTIEGENGICYTHPERLPGTHARPIQDAHACQHI
jgi:hypothetical protein